MIYDKIVEQDTEPMATNVLWMKPKGNGFALYRHRNGRWQALRLMDDAGTPETDDDVVADFSNISEIVEQEVERQMEGYDEKVNDTHNTPTNNDEEYPDIDIL